MTPLSGTVPDAQASYIYYDLFLVSYLFQGILPLNRPSKILLTFILSHFDGIKFLLAGGTALIGNGSVCYVSKL